MQNSGLKTPDLEPYYTAQDIAYETREPINSVIEDLKLARSLQVDADTLTTNENGFDIETPNFVVVNANKEFFSPTGTKSSSNTSSNKPDVPIDAIPNVEPTNYTDIEVRLRAYQIGDAPIIGRFGHAFIEYEDQTTGETRYARAGPSSEYPGGAWDAIRDKAYPGVDVDALDNTNSERIDGNIPGTFEVNSTTIRGNMDDIEQRLNGFNTFINDEDVPYRPRSQNSNTYAGDAYELLTQQDPRNGTDVKLPGLNNDLVNYEQTDYSASFD